MRFAPLIRLRRRPPRNALVQGGQGLLQYLSVTFGKTVWRCFGSWLRTMNQDKAPSEMVVAQALRASLPQFLVVQHGSHDLEKFIVENADISRMPELRLVG